MFYTHAHVCTHQKAAIKRLFCIIPLILKKRIVKILETESRLVIARAEGEERGKRIEVIINGLGFQGKCLKIRFWQCLCNSMYKLKPWIVYFKNMNFMACELNLNKAIMKSLISTQCT